MAEAYFSGGEEESKQLRELNDKVLESPDEYEHWEKLVQAAQGLEGGLNRNSSPQAIAATRDIYDRFLHKFPLFYGYWKKYADMEFSIAGTEGAEMIYERGVASIPNSVDLWTHYCGFKVETCHDPDAIRELFERGASCVGLDFQGHIFWDMWIDFEERVEALDRVFTILARIIYIPLYHYSRYFEKLRGLAHKRPVSELLPEDKLEAIRREQAIETSGQNRSEMELERDLRLRVDAIYVEVYTQTGSETTKRWAYESEIKRHYFHVTELDDAQLANWRKYLDFEEGEGDHARTAFLYERCLVATAYYDEFWLRYARWMSAQKGKDEEVRNIYARAACLYAPIANPDIRLLYAIFEEKSGRVDVAEAIHEAILFTFPGHVETVVSWASLVRRHRGVDAASAVFQAQIDDLNLDPHTKGALAGEHALMLYCAKGVVDEARAVFQKPHAAAMASVGTSALQPPSYALTASFLSKYLDFESNLPVFIAPTTPLEERESALGAARKEQIIRLRTLHESILKAAPLLGVEPTRELTRSYMRHLLACGGSDVAGEYVRLDSEVNGPASVAGSGAGAAKIGGGAAASAMGMVTGMVKGMNGGQGAAQGQQMPVLRYP